jgi:hypothetical protein
MTLMESWVIFLLRHYCQKIRIAKYLCPTSIYLFTLCSFSSSSSGKDSIELHDSLLAEAKKAALLPDISTFKYGKVRVS